MPWMSFSICLLLFVSSLLLALGKCFAVVIDMLRLVVVGSVLTVFWYGVCLHMCQSIVLSI